MPTRAVTRIVPHLWYIKEAEAAAKFYTKIFPKSRIDRVWSLASDSRVRRGRLGGSASTSTCSASRSSP